jgi:hypothetical protein
MTDVQESLDSLVAYCRDLQRVAPLPTKWSRLYEMLPERARNRSGGWEPSLPLILGAWHQTSASEKMIRLQEHLEWAASHGALDVVGRYLRDLPEEDWCHLGDC